MKQKCLERPSMLNSWLFVKIISVVAVVVCVGLGLWYFSLPEKSLFNLRTDGLLTKEAQEAVAANQAAIAQAKSAAIKSIPEVGSQDFVTGDRRAPVVLIVYYDFDCPFSARFHQTLQEAMIKYPGSLAIAWRNFPLNSHPRAASAAAAFVCAADQGQALPAIEKLFALQTTDRMEQSGFMAMAESLGLAEARFKACLIDPATANRVEQEKQAAVDAAVNGTPETFINGKPIAGALPALDYQDKAGETHLGLFSLIDKELGIR